MRHKSIRQCAAGHCADKKFRSRRTRSTICSSISQYWCKKTQTRAHFAQEKLLWTARTTKRWCGTDFFPRPRHAQLKCDAAPYLLFTSLDSGNCTINLADAVSIYPRRSPNYGHSSRLGATPWGRSFCISPW